MGRSQRSNTTLRFVQSLGIGENGVVFGMVEKINEFTLTCSDWESIMAELEETVALTVDQLLEPTKNGLIPKSD